MEPAKTELTQFAEDVLLGLNKEQKSIPSKYFYDAEGDRIFQQIMEMPEYYLTNCEYDILNQQKHDILDAANALNEPVNLVEFGAGDGLKTKLLLQYLLDHNADFTYYPVDISASILEHLENDLNEQMPGLLVDPMNMDYFAALHEMKNLNDRHTLILFLGSNIGNFRYRDAAGFLSKLADESNPGDMLLLGVDLKKDPQVILNAYDDPHGITAAFNLNLLHRMNRELEADFCVSDFAHYTVYEEEKGEVLSYLRSLKSQKINFSLVGETVEFEENESIHTEISKKYSLEELGSLAEEMDFEVIRHFLDEKKYFTDTLWRIGR